MIIFQKKKILIGLILFFILLLTVFATAGIYWYFTIYQKSVPVAEIPTETPEKTKAKTILGEWLLGVLKPEFLPSELEIELGVDIGGGVTQDKNTYGYNWHYLGKNFYTALDYNNEKPGINAYVLAVFWDEKIDLDQEAAPELFENYFNLPEKPDLICEREKMTEEGIADYCQGAWTDKEKNRHNISAVSTEKNEKGWTMFIYYLTPLESESYEKE